MVILTHTCPHCKTNHIALSIVSTNKSSHKRINVYLLCPKCRDPSIAILSQYHRVNQPPTPWQSFAQLHSDVKDIGWKVDEFWPSATAEVPELLPPEVERIYRQAEHNFPIEGNEEASGTMYRKALDIGLGKIDASLKGMLGQKIKQLAGNGGITSDIAERSGNIRDLGNDAAHELNPITREELTELRNFTEMVLRYLFSLPNAIKKKRGEKLLWEP